jgi:hypothetical protein
LDNKDHVLDAEAHELLMFHCISVTLSCERT